MARSKFQQATLDAMKPGEANAYADHLMRRDARIESAQDAPELRAQPNFGEGTHWFFEDDDGDEPAIVAVALEEVELE